MAADSLILSEGHARPASPLVSVIVTSYRGRDRIERALGSLANQTLPADRFEVVVVVNGPDDGTADLLERHWRGGRLAGLRLLTTPVAGVAAAGNLALGAIGGQYVTWVDDDDWVSPTYLADLVERAAPDVVVLAPFADVTAGPGPGQVVSFDNYLNRAILAHAGGQTTFAQLPTAAAANSGKLVPAAMLRGLEFDTTLTSGQDVVLWAQVLARFDPRLAVLGPSAHGRYYRLVRSDSVSRALDDAFLDSRLSVLSQLDALARRYPRAQPPLRGLLEAQARHLGRFLVQWPQRRDEVMTRIDRLGLADFPYAEVNHGAADLLVISYAFPPYNDTSGIVVAKRLIERGEPFDAVTHDMAPARGLDESLEALVKPLLGRRIVVEGPPSSESAAAAMEFCRAGARAVRGRTVSWGPYAAIYSRTMWPASHALGALLKVRYPSSRWVAEFSDPLDVNSSGQRRTAQLADDAVVAEIAAAIGARGLPTTTSGLYYEWLEDIVYALADEIVFTNPRQRDLMLGHARSGQLAARAEQLGRVAAHPTLPAQFYGLRAAPVRLAGGVVHLGYFGMFYAVRGPEVLLDALAALAPDRRRRLCLHVYTDQVRLTRLEARRRRLGRSVEVYHYLPYLEFLNLTTRLDWLVVTDARARDIHGLNPYLPSKLSDYRGSGSRIWGIVEPGSMLAQAELDLTTELGDSAAAAAALGQIADQPG